MMAGLRHITVLKGGPSKEREVSLRTGQAVAAALRDLGYHVTEVLVEGPDLKIPAETDLVFISLHGTFGEDGQVQSILEKRNLPFTGCGVEASRLAFDKAASKTVFQKSGIPTPTGAAVRAGQAVLVPLPFVVKPAREGSSVGLNFVENESEITGALARAHELDEVAIVERLIRGRELTVGILGNEALPIVEIRPKQGHYDYQNKYTAGATDYFCPAELPLELTKRVQQVAREAHESLGCTVYSRVDVMLEESGQPWVLEVNTIPGMTATSLLPKAAQAAGLSFGALCERIAELSLIRYQLTEAA